MSRAGLRRVSERESDTDRDRGSPDARGSSAGESDSDIEHNNPKWRRRKYTSKSESAVDVKPKTSKTSARPGSFKSDSGVAIRSNEPKTSGRSHSPQQQDTSRRRRQSSRPRSRSPKTDDEVIIESNTPKVSARRPSDKNDQIFIESNVPKTIIRRSKSRSRSPRKDTDDDDVIIEHNVPVPKTRSRTPRSEVFIVESNVPKITARTARSVSQQDVFIEYNTPKLIIKPTRAKELVIGSTVSITTRATSPGSETLHSTYTALTEAESVSAEDEEELEEIAKEQQAHTHFAVSRNREAHIKASKVYPSKGHRGHSLTTARSSRTARGDQGHRTKSEATQISPRGGQAMNNQQQSYGANLVSFSLGHGLTGGIFVADPNASKDGNNLQLLPLPAPPPTYLPHTQIPPAHQPIYPALQQGPFQQPLYPYPLQPPPPPSSYTQMPVVPMQQSLVIPPRYPPLQPISQPSLGGGKKPLPLTEALKSSLEEGCGCGFHGHHADHKHHHHHHYRAITLPDTPKSKDEDADEVTNKPYPPVGPIHTSVELQSAPPTLLAPWYQSQAAHLTKLEAQQKFETRKKTRPFSAYSAFSLTDYHDPASYLFRPHRSLLDKLAGFPREPSPNVNKQIGNVTQFNQQLLQQQQQLVHMQQQQLQQNKQLPDQLHISLDIYKQDEDLALRSHPSRKPGANNYKLPRSASEEGRYEGRDDGNKGALSKTFSPLPYYNFNDEKNKVKARRAAMPRSPLFSAIGGQGQTKMASRPLGKAPPGSAAAQRSKLPKNLNRRPLGKGGSTGGLRTKPARTRSGSGLQDVRPYLYDNESMQQQQPHTYKPLSESLLDIPDPPPASAMPAHVGGTDSRSSFHPPPPVNQYYYPPYPYHPPNIPSPILSEELGGDALLSNLPEDLDFDFPTENYDVNDDEQGEGQLSSKTKGNLITFYLNGDRFHPGVATAVNKKMFSVFKTLLEWLTEKISTPSGVKFIFRVPDGIEVTRLNEFEPGRSYVVSSTRKYIRLPYGNTDLAWYNTPPSPSRIRKGEPQTLLNRDTLVQQQASPRAPSAAPVTGRGKMLTIISNTHRNSQQKVFLNPDTSQTFEQMLTDVGSMIRLQRPPVTALYMAHPPYRKMESFSHLMKATKYTDTFIACGREGVIREMQFNPELKVKAKHNSARPSSSWQQSENGEFPAAFQPIESEA